MPIEHYASGGVMRHSSWPALVPGVIGVVCSASGTWPVKDSSLRRYEEPLTCEREFEVDQSFRIEDDLKCPTIFDHGLRQMHVDELTTNDDLDRNLGFGAGAGTAQETSRYSRPAQAD